MRRIVALGVAAWSSAAGATEPELVVDADCLPSLRAWLEPPEPPPAIPVGETTSTTVGQVVTREFLQKIPTGRSYQEAVRLTAGSNGGGAWSWSDPPLPPATPAGVEIRGEGPRWGGTVFLSNDDGGSLASAQRLLDQLDRRAAVDPAAVRPHELLNAFPFEGFPAPRTDAFTVSPSAYLDGTEVSLALLVQAPRPERPPLDLTLVVDRSGSMASEERMPLVQRALDRLGAGLRPGDTVDVVLFDDQVCTAVRDFTAGRDDPRLWTAVVAGLTPRGSTDLNRGLQTGYALARAAPADPARLRRVVLFTDALLNTGVTDVELVTEVGRAFDERGIRLTAAGLGDDFRDDVLWKLTEKGRGSYVFLGGDDVVDRMFGPELDRLLQSVAEDVRFALHLPPSLGIRRFFGEEASFDERDVRRVHLGAGERQVFLQQLALRAGDRAEEPVVLEVDWHDPGDGRARQATFTWTVAALLRTRATAARRAVAVVSWAELVRDVASGDPRCGTRLADWRRDVHDAELLRLADRTAGWCGATARASAPPPRRWYGGGSSTSAVTLLRDVACPELPLPALAGVPADPFPGTCPTWVDPMRSAPPDSPLLRGCQPTWVGVAWCGL